MTCMLAISTKKCTVVIINTSILILIFLPESASSYCVTHVVAVVASGAILTITARIILVWFVHKVIVIVVFRVALISTLLLAFIIFTV